MDSLLLAVLLLTLLRYYREEDIEAHGVRKKKKDSV
jgi:hypothetical protein